MSGLPEGIDFACAAMGRAAGHVVLDLLRRRVHVLCEHPVGEVFVREALQIAGGRGVSFHVNAHFADLPAPLAFARHCAGLRRGSEPLSVEARVADRALFGAVDLMARTLGMPLPSGSRHAGTERPSSAAGPAFRRISGSLGGAPLTCWVQTGDPADASELPDGSAAYRHDCRIAVGFPAGLLILEALAGPVVWRPGDRIETSSGSEPAQVLEPAASDRRTLSGQRTRANLHALERLAVEVETGEVLPEQRPGHLIEVAAGWDRLSSVLGMAAASGRNGGA